MGEKGASRDQAIARIAARQHGVVTVAQLRDVGVSAKAAAKRTRVGRLHRLHRGVYAVGHPAVSIEGRWLAAVLACGAGAALSHRSAAELWRLLEPAPGPVQVSLDGTGGRRRRRGIVVHRRVALPADLLTQRNSIPVTTPAQTLLDLRGAVSPALVRRARREAAARGLHLDYEAAPTITRSELEDRFLALCRRRRLPAPEVNVRVGDFEVDFLWRRARLIVETDGYRFHRGAAAFERDRRRDLALRTQGYEVVRLSYDQVTNRPTEVGTVLTKLLR